MIHVIISPCTRGNSRHPSLFPALPGPEAHTMPLLHLSFSPSLLPSRAFACTPNPLLFNSHLIMSLGSKPISRPDDRQPARCHTVPGLSAEEVAAASEEAFGRHSSPDLKRSGTGVAIMWFRNDLRVLDNEALIRAWAASDALLPVYCVDPRHFGTTHYFGFPKTGGKKVDGVTYFGSVFCWNNLCVVIC